MCFCQVKSPEFVCGHSNFRCKRVIIVLSNTYVNVHPDDNEGLNRKWEMIFSQAWAPIAQKMHKLVPVVIEPEVVVPREYQVVFVIIMTFPLTFHHQYKKFVMHANSCRDVSDNNYPISLELNT